MAFRRRGRLMGMVGAAALSGLALAPAMAELPIEPTPNVLSLPSDYPDSWVYLVDSNFFGIESGKVVIADVGAESHQMKGEIGYAQFGFFAQAKTRPETYVVETFYSRGSRGQRTDVISIYDNASLLSTGEIVLEGNKRAQILSEPGAFQLSHDERFAYLFYFTPAASVGVIDLVNRKVVNEIDIPGCAHAYALKDYGLASLCGYGSVVTTRLDSNGKLVSQTMSEPFNDIDADPMYSRGEVINGVGYFPTYGGSVQPIDFSGDTAVVGKLWKLSADEGDAKDSKRLFGLLKSKPKGSWLPSGWQLMTSDDEGRLYVIMRANATMDDHDTGGGEVWVFNPKTHELVQTIELDAESSLIEVTHGADPYLVALRPDQSVDVYKAKTGEWIRNIGGGMLLTSFSAQAAN